MSVPLPTGRPADRPREQRPLTCGDARQTTTTVGLPLSARTPKSRRRSLSERDELVLEALAILRLATGDQLQRLCVTDGSPQTRSRRTRALLERLFDLKLVVRLDREIGRNGGGSSGYVYGLSGRGQAALGIGGVHGGKRRRVWQTKPDFLDHLLEVGTMYVGLVEAARSGTIELLDFQAEPAAWRTFSGSAGEVVTLKPDAFARLATHDLERSVFIEVDLASESSTTIFRKGAAYVSYWRTGLEQAAHEVFPQVSWLTKTEKRAHQIITALTRLPAEAHRLFEVGLLSDAITILTSTAQGGSMA